jgi:eukaryotic-like serine/threonine-protein kinase
MSNERWRRIEKLFHEAADLAPIQRAEFLSRACAGDGELRRQVESLLANDRSKGDVFEVAVANAVDHLPDDLMGLQLGPYLITELIGEGGMGRVYKASDAKLKRDVALKVLPEGFAQDPDRMLRFQREAEVLASLNHPNIVVIHDAGSQDGMFYVATELLEGETLRKRLAGHAVPVRKTIDYAIQIARGLAAAHAKGITHRDLKPENLFLTKDGLVKILDFGLAKYSALRPIGAHPTDLATQPIETQPGMVLGTAGYMSPEQVRGQVADARSDLFSLGVVLYEMVSGRRAFTGESGVEVMSAILQKEPPELDTALPPGLERIIHRCLEKKPEERFESARDLAFALEYISGTTSSGIQRIPEKPRRRYAWEIALVALACLIVVAFVVGRRTSRAPSPSFQRVTFRRGFIDSGRFANGGKTIVYSAAWDGNPFRVYSTQAESPESRDLGLASARLLGVSPSDEMAVAFTPGLSWVSGTLARAPISGGTPRQVADDIAYADWGSDGKRLAVVRAKAGFQQIEFPVGNVLYQTTGGIGDPRISPKGDLIAFLDFPLGSSGPGSVATVDLKGNKKTLTDLWLGFVSGLKWSPSSDEILFTAAPYGQTSSLYAVNRLGRQRLIAHLPGEFILEDVAPDGRILMSHAVQSNALFYLPNVESKETDLYWHDSSIVSDISRDGKSLLFSESGDAARSGEDSVTYLRGTDGSAAVRLGPGFPLEISPDGKWAMVLGSTRAPSQLVLLPTGTGEARPLTHDGIHHQGAAWTPDGRRIVFLGNEPGHRIRYYVQSTDGSPPRAITPENVSFNYFDPVAMSPDGRSVAVAGLDGKIVLYPLDDGAPRVVPKLAEGFIPLRWCPGNSLMVYHAGDVPVRILRADVETGEQTLWKEWAPANRTGLSGIPAIRVGANCQSSAYSAWYQPSDLWIAAGLR